MTQPTLIKVNILSTPLMVIGTIFFLFNTLVFAQITNVTDCSETPEFEILSRVNQTREEIIAKMDKEFVDKISDQESCQKTVTGSDSGGGAGGNGGGGGASGGGEGASVQTKVIAAPNQIQAGESSVTLDENLSLLGYPSQNSNNLTPADSNGQNGRSEMDLLRADADAQLIEDLKKQIDQEQDPQIKANLEEMLKELEKSQ